MPDAELQCSLLQLLDSVTILHIVQSNYLALLQRESLVQDLLQLLLGLQNDSHESQKPITANAAVQ